MKLSRRQLLSGTAASALVLSSQNADAFWHGKPPAIASGWQGFPLGDGGYIIGTNVSATGMAGGAVCKTDVAGGYYWNGSTWLQVCSSAALGTTQAPPSNGVWEICGAPSDFNQQYMVYGDTNGVVGAFAVYARTGANGVWVKTDLKFSAASSVPWSNSNGDLPNSPYRLTNQKIVVDPANPLVAYVGIPFAVTLTGTYSASTPSVFRTLDGGATWAAVSGLPAAANYPGYAGMVIDKSSGTTTLSGVTVTNRIILPCSGIGIYESTNGGASFSKITSDATPSTTVTYTTTQANSIIVVQVQCYGVGIASSVTNSAGDPSGSLTWAQRAGPTRNDFYQLVLFEFYAVAPTAGTYHISVNYVDGCLAYLTNTTNDASCTLGTISGTAFTEAGVTTGVFAIGQELTGTGLPTSSANAGIGTGIGSSIYIVSGSSPNWVINSPFTLAARVFNGRTRVTNEVNVFAVTGCDVSSMPSSAFDSGGPKVSATPGAAVNITTAAANCLVFAFGYSKASPGSTTPDAGYTLMGNVANPSFWSEISSTALATGLKTPGSAITSQALCLDALKQGAAMTIALDGTPTFATSGPSPGTQPVNITTAQIDNSGTYWSINGASNKSVGGIWRLKASVMDRVSGSAGAVASANLVFGQPGGGAVGACAICVDPRSGKEGFVTFTGPNSQFRGFQTQNGNASLAAMTWIGVTGGTLTSNVTASVVPWLGTGATTSQGKAVGDMVIDPITGEYIQASGHGMYRIASNLNFASGSFVCNADNISQGIEEILVADILSIPGAPNNNVLVGCEDEITLLTDLPRYPSAQVGPSIVDSDAWNLDYASDNPAFVWAFVTGLVTARASCWSNNYGVAGSWFAPVNLPPAGGALGGCMACASTGSGGLSSSNATAKVVIIPGSGTTTPIYTLDNGTNWQNCVGLPTQSYIGTKERPCRLLAADRVNIGTYYCYAPGTGVYQSTDSGANWTKVSTFIAPGGAGANSSYMLLPVPGFAGHLWLVSNNGALGTQNLNYSTDGGANWSQVAGVTSAANPGGTSLPIYLALGKVAPGNAYPTLMTYAKIGGVDGFYRGLCNGAGPSSGFTWTFFGDRTSVPASQVVGSASAAGFTQMWGDWNTFGRVYVGWSQNGAFMYNP